MAEPLADQLTRKIDRAAVLYRRLLMVAAPAGMGKTSALHHVHDRTGAPLININLEVSLRRLDWSALTRPIRMAKKLQHDACHNRMEYETRSPCTTTV
jgi:MoxR-like ATPase